MAKGKKNKARNILIVLVVVVILCIPIKQCLKDGGSIRYQAILYSVTKVHELDLDGDYITGIRINILGIPVIDTTK